VRDARLRPLRLPRILQALEAGETSFRVGTWEEPGPSRRPDLVPRDPRQRVRLLADFDGHLGIKPVKARSATSQRRS
jgi:hypothetical protein